MNQRPDPASPEPIQARAPLPWFTAFRPQRSRQVLERQVTVTLTLMGAVMLPAMLLWLGAKLVWNQDPFHSQPFRPVEASSLTARAKDVALHFHHALNTADFGVARLLTTSEAEVLVTDREQQCQRTGCGTPPAHEFATRAIVLQSQSSSALIRAETFEGRTLRDVATYDVIRHEGRWLVKARL